MIIIIFVIILLVLFIIMSLICMLISVCFIAFVSTDDAVVVPKTHVSTNSSRVSSVATDACCTT